MSNFLPRFRSGHFAALSIGALATVAAAQPTLTEDLGVLSDGVPVARTVTLSGGAVSWYKLTIPPVPAGGTLYLDLRTHNPDATIIDTEFGFFDAVGNFASGAVGTSSDDDDGPGFGSSLSYGAACPTRPNDGTGTQGAGAAFNGRDGGLAGGDYYLAVAPYNSAFTVPWTVTGGSQNGTMQLEIVLGTVGPSIPTLTAATAAPGGVAAGEAVLFTATATACGAPTAATIDLSPIGGSATAAMYDDGTNGDVTAGNNVWSLSTIVPAATPIGPYTVTVTASNAAGPTTRDINFAVQGPPATLTPVGGVYTEVEDNETKTRANRILSMQVGESIGGNTTGAVTTVGAPNSYDMFRLTMAPAAPGIYETRMTIDSETAGHTGVIFGLNQTGGVVGTTDTVLQTSTATTVPARYVQWYGFGRSETINYRIAGTTATTSDYSAVLSRSTVTPVDLGNFAPGNIVITTIGQGHTTDTDLWIYDSAFNAIPDAGNDDESIAGGGSGATLQSILTRTYAPGRYYLALSDFNTCNNLPSPADDDYRTGAVLDFPNAILQGDTGLFANMQFAMTDSAGTLTFPASKSNPFEIYWGTFTVGTVSTCGTSDFNNDGDSGTDADIEAFFACLAGACCPTCPADADFNGDGDVGTDADIEAFFRVLAGGTC